MRDLDNIKLIESQIGQEHGKAKVTSANRTIFKKWIRALGVPSKATEKFTLKTLTKCYNIASYLNAVLRNEGLEPYYFDKAANLVEADFEEVQEIPTPTPEIIEKFEEAKKVTNKKEDKLALLEKLLGNDQEIDMDMKGSIFVPLRSGIRF